MFVAATHTIDEGAADMARYTTLRDSLDATVRAPLTTERPRTATPQFPGARRRNSGPVIRGAQTRSTAVRRPLRIPGR